MIGARASPGFELCKRARNMDLKATDVLPTKTVAHIQSAVCKAQKLPWDEIADEAERLLERNQANQQVPDDDHVDKEQEDDQGVDRDETDPYNETIFGRRRPDSIHHHQGSLARGTGEGMRMHTCLEINRVVLKSHWWKRHQ
jgi:hypothetical protein